MNPYSVPSILPHNPTTYFPLQDLGSLPSSPPPPCPFFLNPLNYCLHVHGYKAMHWSMGNSSGAASLGKSWFPFPSIHQLPTAHQLLVELHESLLWLTWSPAGIVHTLTTAESIVKQSWCVQQIMFHCRHPLLLVFASFLWWSQSFKERTVIYVPSRVCYFLYLILCTLTT